MCRAQLSLPSTNVDKISAYMWIRVLNSDAASSAGARTKKVQPAHTQSKRVSIGEHNATAMAQLESASSVAPGWLKAPSIEVDFFCMCSIGAGAISRLC